MRGQRGEQAHYNRLLDAFGARAKTYHEGVAYLIGLGFTDNQAKNAVHVHRKGGPAQASFRLSRDERNGLLDGFGARRRTPKECVEHLMNQGCKYGQATSAVYQFRKEKGLIP